MSNAEATVAVFGCASPKHLKQWMLETGREFMIFVSADLIDALPWPSGHEFVQQIVTAYDQFRRVEGKDQSLTAEEMEHAIQVLVRELRNIRPNWRPQW